MLYWFCALTVLFSTLSSFIANEGYYTEKVPDGNVQFWPLDWNPDADKIKALNSAYDEERDICVNPKKYEFCDDPDCAWSALAMRCVDLCTDDSVEDCIEPAERFLKTDSSLFFPTFFTEITTKKIGDDTVTGRHVTTKKRVIKGVESMGVSFQHEYDILTPTHERQEGSSRLEEPDGLLTILRDLDGNDVVKWVPGERVNLSLENILKAGGVSLDAVETKEIDRNFLENATFADGILSRLAGIEITLELSYHNPSSYAHPGDGHKGPVCLIKVYRKYWSSQQQLQVVDHLGSSRFRYYQGVRVRFRATGSFSFVNMDQIFNKLSQILVFFGATKQLVFFFTISCLGVVSKVYKGFVYQKVSLGKETCGMAARLTSHTSTYVELKDNAHGISEERLLRRFKRIFQFNEEIDDAEIRRLVNFIYKRMAKHDKDGIDVQDFAMACTHGEALHFRTLVELFDADRKKGFLEKTFAGPTIRHLFETDKDLFNTGRTITKPIDMTKQQTDVFDAGFVAVPVPTVAVTSDESKGSTERASDGLVQIDEVKILHDGEHNAPLGPERVDFRNEVGKHHQDDSNLFPFVSSNFVPPSPIRSPIRGGAYDWNDDPLAKVDESILAPCEMVCSSGFCTNPSLRELHSRELHSHERLGAAGHLGRQEKSDIQKLQTRNDGLGIRGSSDGNPVVQRIQFEVS